jgi:catechol 2,3-dioxygenase-like lactoylglutathione lyase family enzyme
MEAMLAFYRDGLGLAEIGRFQDHEGYDGLILDVPNTGAHIEFTWTDHLLPAPAHPEHLLVLYLGNWEEVRHRLDRLDATSVPAANPYWDRVGVTILDPDGFRVVLVADTWPRGGRAGAE